MTQEDNQEKSRYELSRDGISREKIEELSGGTLTKRKLEKIENGSQLPRPEDVYFMSKTYKDPDLANYYCSSVCPIGKEHVPEVGTTNLRDLPQITLALLSCLNTLNNDRDKIIDAAADGEITEDEKKSFKEFQDHLKKMTLAVEALRIWAAKEIDLL